MLKTAIFLKPRYQTRFLIFCRLPSLLTGVALELVNGSLSRNATWQCRTPWLCSTPPVYLPYLMYLTFKPARWQGAWSEKIKSGLTTDNACYPRPGSEISVNVFGRMRKPPRSSVSLKIADCRNVLPNMIILKTLSLMLCTSILHRTFQENMPDDPSERSV